MATNLQIDDELIQKAVRLGGHKTKKAAVSKALTEYIQNLEQQKETCYRLVPQNINKVN